MPTFSDSNSRNSASSTPLNSLLNASRWLPVDLLCAPLGKSLAIRLCQARCCVYQSRSSFHQITVSWICACALRYLPGPSSCGSILASRASAWVSCRSSFRLLLVINRIFCAWATITPASELCQQPAARVKCVRVRFFLCRRQLLSNAVPVRSSASTLRIQTPSPLG